MYCNKCGAQFKDASQRFCENCGSDIFKDGYSNTPLKTAAPQPQTPAQPQPQQGQAQQWTQDKPQQKQAQPQWTPPQPTAPQPTPGAWSNPVPPTYVNNFYSEKREPITVGGWILRSLIPMIPIVGSLIYFIMLFVWSGDKSKEESFNNWAKAQLWTMLIVAILVVFILIIGFAVGISFLDSL